MPLAVEQAARAREIDEIILGKAGPKLMVAQDIVRLRLPSVVGHFCHRGRRAVARGFATDCSFGRRAKIVAESGEEE